MKSVKYTPEAFQKFILINQVVGFFSQEITLSSGRKSTWYVNWRTLTSDAYLMNQLVEFVLSYVQEKNIAGDCFYGTPDGATKLAVICQHTYAQRQDDYAPGKYPLAMGRKVPKEHGQPQDRYFVGAPQGKVLVLEDVTTTGDSLLKTVQQLQDLEIEVAAAIALTNRNEVADSGKHVRESLQELNVPYFSMSDAIELLPLLAQQQELSSETIQSITSEFELYGESPIKL